MELQFCMLEIMFICYVQRDLSSVGLVFIPYFRANRRNGYEHGHGRAVALHVNQLHCDKHEKLGEVSSAVDSSSFTKKEKLPQTPLLTTLN